MIQALRILVAIAGCALVAEMASAQGLTRPIRVVVGVPPGGSSDTAIRLIAPRMSEALGQSLVVDNRPGSNGVAGTEIASKAAPDGLTFSVGNSGTHAINGIFAPAKTPHRMIRAANKAAVAALNAPEIRERFNTLGFTVIGDTPEEFAAIIRREVDKYRKVIAESGIPLL